MNADGTDVRELTTGLDQNPDWVGSSVVHGVEFTQAIQSLQAIGGLQSDLAGDGKPPVPIVAGKPAAMRVYFDEVEQSTTYTVELSGEFEGTEQVTLVPGCTPELQREQDNDCDSVDFYFTPPAGQWEVKLEVKEAGTVIEEHEFNLTSVDTAPLAIRYTPRHLCAPPPTSGPPKVSSASCSRWRKMSCLTARSRCRPCTTRLASHQTTRFSPT
jgi:hypothetical protein